MMLSLQVIVSTYVSTKNVRDGEVSRWERSLIFIYLQMWRLGH